MISGASAVPMLTSISAGQRDQRGRHGDTDHRVGRAPASRSASTRCAEPGTAPSRLNANVIREAEVRQEVAQKNCADAEMNSTSVAQFLAERAR